MCHKKHYITLPRQKECEGIGAPGFVNISWLQVRDFITATIFLTVKEPLLKILKIENLL